MNNLANLTPGQNQLPQINTTVLKYVLCEVLYGGRITDDRDRRLIKVYAKEIFEDSLIAIEKWRPVGTEEYNYIYPADEANTKLMSPAELYTPEYFL